MNLTVLVSLGVFWTVYGLAGLLGFQVIPEQYRGHDWTLNYIRRRGISWLLAGIPWLILYPVLRGRAFSLSAAVLVIVCALPSIMYSLYIEKKYKPLLHEK